MTRRYDLNSTISAAQKEVESWEQRASLATRARPAGSRWPLTLLTWSVLLLALFTQRHSIAELIEPPSSDETIEQLSEIMRHTAADIEQYRQQFGALPDSVPIDFLHGVILYRPDDSGYILEASYHNRALRLSADASGPGRIEVTPQ